MKALKAIVIAITLNVILIGSIYYGEINNNENITNIPVFIYWVVSVISIFTVFMPNAAIKKRIEKDENAFTKNTPQWFTIGIVILITLSLAFFGYLILAAAYALASISQHIIRDRASEIRAEMVNSSKKRKQDNK